MSPSKKAIQEKASSVTSAVTHPSRSAIPNPLRFPLLLLVNLTVSSLLYTVAATYGSTDLGGVSRRLDEWWEVAGLIGWRAIELAVGWICNFDGIDLATLTLLSHMPPLYLLANFYAIPLPTVAGSLAIDILSAYVSFRLLRPLTAVHDSRVPVINRSIIDDIPVRASTAFLATAIYATVFYASYHSWLPIYLVTHFDGIRDISAAHSPALPMLFLSSIPIGLAVQEFIFTPSTGLKIDTKKEAAPAFNPETASLGETIKYNVWGYSERCKVVIKRTAILMAVTGLNTWLQTFVTIEGVENYGAIGYAGVWATAVALTGAAYLWVGEA
ncbi:MAG: hypothetical protein M1817_004825 [Caeruleum heppii]|nr:MAG: hypothetical protein M1817_004825 [Caeruleum heppii]